MAVAFRVSMFVRPALALALFMSLAGCGADLQIADDDVDDLDAVTTVDDDKADGISDIKAQVTGLTVWLDPQVVHQVRDGRGVWVITGRTSKNLDGVFSFIPDDAYAQANRLSARKFEVVFDDASEANTLLSGLRLLINLDVAGSDLPATAALRITPRTTTSTGSSRLHVWKSWKPIAIGSELLYRGQASSTVDGTLGASGEAPPALSVRSARHWNLDLGYGGLATHLAGAPLVVGLGNAREQAQLGIGISELALSRRDPYEAFPGDFDCAPAVQACLDGLGDDPDTEPCGSYRQVRLCNVRSELPQLGAAPDDTSTLQGVIAGAMLPAGQTVAFEDLYVQAPSDSPSSIIQVVRAYIAYLGDGLGELRFEGDTDQGTVTQLMNEAQIPGFPAAADAATASSQPMFYLLDGMTDAAHTRYVLFYYPQAARLIVARYTTTD